MSELSKREIDILNRLDEVIPSENLSNNFLVQLIERAASFLNLETIPDCAKQNNLSYNGVKKTRNIVQIRGVKFVIDND